MNLSGDLEYIYVWVCSEWTWHLILFAEIMSEAEAILILVLVSQTKKLISSLVIPDT